MTERAPDSTRRIQRLRKASFPKSPFVISTCANVIALMFLTLWIGLHPSAERSLNHPIQAWDQRDAKTGLEFAPILSDALIVPFVAVCIAVISLFTIAWVLLLSTTKQSRLRRWLLFMTLCATWLGLANGWRDVAWTGKKVRFAHCVPKLQSCAVALHHDWPESDGNLEGLGPFMAYPVYKPKTLLLLTPPRLETWDNSAIAAVELAPMGGVRFQLASGEPPGRSAENDWLEWHPSASVPDSFTGGLSERFQIVQSSSLGNGWFLTRYERPLPQTVPDEDRRPIATIDLTSHDFE